MFYIFRDDIKFKVILEIFFLIIVVSIGRKTKLKKALIIVVNDKYRKGNF